MGNQTKENRLIDKTVNFGPSPVSECIHCGEHHFETDAEFSRHQILHGIHNDSNTNDLNCHYCDEIFRSNNLKDHNTEFHDGLETKHGCLPKILPCDLCDRKFASTDSWILHVAGHVVEENFTCQVCACEFNDKSEYLHHVKSHSLCKLYRCDFCAEPFIYAISRDRHVLKKHSDGSISCKRKGKMKLKHSEETEPVTDLLMEDNEEDQDSESSFAFVPPNIKEPKVKVELELSERSEHSQKLLKTVRCETCGFMFETEERMLEHAKKHLEVKKFVCDICGNAYRTCKSLESHKLVHTGEKPFKCDKCDKSFRSRVLLYSHRKSHEPGKRNFVCSKCGKSYRSLSVLSIHEATHSDTKQCYCSVCGKGFCSDYSLQRHMRMHTGESPFSCEYCQQSFRVKRSMLTHMEVHFPEKIYTCSTCHKKFGIEVNCTDHERNHVYTKEYRDRHGLVSPVMTGYKNGKGVTDPGGKCDICGKFLATGFGLYSHTLTHKRPPLTCKECGLTFTIRHHYDNHLATHSGDAFKCRHCNKVFVKEERMRIHEREAHTGDKPYKCSVCSDAFTTRARLKAHERVHKGIAIVCEYCGKLFQSKSAKTKHMRQHKGVEEDEYFLCPKCPKKFKDEHTLTRHLQSHDVLGSPEYACHCGKTYANSTSMHSCMSEHLEAQQSLALVNKSPKNLHTTGHPPDLGDKLTALDNATRRLENARSVTVSAENGHQGAMVNSTPTDRQGSILSVGSNSHHQVAQQNYVVAADVRNDVTLDDVTMAENNEVAYRVAPGDGREVVYVCSLCHQGFLTNEDYSEHSKLHIY